MSLSYVKQYQMHTCYERWNYKTSCL